MGRSGAARKPGAAAPAREREKSRAELQAEERDRRIDENMTRVGVDGDDVLLVPKWAPRPAYRSFLDWQDISHYELFLEMRYKEWGDLDRDTSEIHFVNPDALDEILKLLPDAAGVDGLRRALKIYDAGVEAGRSAGYEEGYNDGESAASDSY